MTAFVVDARTGDPLPGLPTDRLVAESLRAWERGDAGVVLAYRGVVGVWDLVAETEQDLHAALGREVRAVWVRAQDLAPGDVVCTGPILDPSVRASILRSVDDGELTADEAAALLRVPS